MANKFDEMRQAVQEAKNTLDAADSVADDLARMLIGRLHRVQSSYTLAKLKRELRDFNMHTSSWKSDI